MRDLRQWPLWSRTILVPFGIVVCFSTVSAPAQFASEALQFQMVRFEKDFGAGDSIYCCATLQAEFPEFIAGASRDALAAINAFVRYFLPVSSEREPGYTLDEIADGKIRLWREGKNRVPRTTLGTVETFNVSIVHNGDGLLCLKFDWWSSGGAHPIRRISYVNFESITGRRMWLSDLFARGYEDSLSARAERAFRESLGIAADSSLEAAGYRFKEGRFTLTENVLIDTSGILLLWNEYELAAYVFGQQRIKLGFETITDLIPAHGVFARVAASRPAKR